METKAKEYFPLHDIGAMLDACKASFDGDRAAWRKEHEAIIAASERNFEYMQEIDSAAIKQGGLKYRFIYIQVADGLACYQILKVNKKTVKIKHVTGLCDDYIDRRLDDGGTFPLQTINFLLK